MDLDFTAEEEAFRLEVRTFLEEHLPARLQDKVRTSKTLTKADQEEWHAILNKKGWLANHWPVEHGGTGWSVVKRFIFEDECCRAAAPRLLPFGLNMLGPVLLKYGSEHQKAYWLPRILNGDDWWCQGYSEPGAGSDLAAIKTSAVREGDHYIVNGQKTWTTQAQHANMIFCLVRTSQEEKPQKGISFLLIDMASAGITQRPIKTLDGGLEINEVFLDNVKVPVENLVGIEGQGWTYAKYLLTYERTNIAGVGFAVADLERLKNLARSMVSGEGSVGDDPLFAARMAKVEIALDNMKTTNLRMIAAVAGGGAPGAESSVLKIQGTEIRQEILSLIRRASGPFAQPYIPASFAEGYNEESIGPEGTAAASKNHLNYRKLSIYGGSNEIQKNIIAKAILGL